MSNVAFPMPWQIKPNLNQKKPKEIYADLRKDDSLSCTRDFRVIKNQKYEQKKKKRKYIVVFILRQNLSLLTASITFDYFIVKLVMGGCIKKLQLKM